MVAETPESNIDSDADQILYSDGYSPVHCSSLLFLDKCLLSQRTPVLRGVEQFNLALLEDLAARHIQLTLPAHESWHSQLKQTLPGARLFPVPRTPWPLLNSLLLALNPRLQSHDSLLIGNCARDLILALWCLNWRGLAKWRVLNVHRHPSQRLLLAWRHSLDKVITVNQHLAGQFRRHRYPQVDCYFGEPRAQRFFPALNRAANPRLRFCVLGALHTPVKGISTAVAGFQALPAHLQEQCELHLIGFHGELPTVQPGIICYPWQDDAALPTLLREMDVLIVPSHHETFSLVMVKGMLTGLPVLARNIPVLAEKLDQGGGQIFNDEAELSQQMAKLAVDPALRQQLGEAARRTALARYCWDVDTFLACSGLSHG